MHHALKSSKTFQNMNIYCLPAEEFRISIALKSRRYSFLCWNNSTNLITTFQSKFRHKFYRFAKDNLIFMPTTVFIE